MECKLFWKWVAHFIYIFIIYYFYIYIYIYYIYTIYLYIYMCVWRVWVIHSVALFPWTTVIQFRKVCPSAHSNAELESLGWNTMLKICPHGNSVKFFSDFSSRGLVFLTFPVLIHLKFCHKVALGNYYSPRRCVALPSDFEWWRSSNVICQFTEAVEWVSAVIRPLSLYFCRDVRDLWRQCAGWLRLCLGVFLLGVAPCVTITPSIRS